MRSLPPRPPLIKGHYHFACLFVTLFRTFAHILIGQWVDYAQGGAPRGNNRASITDAAGPLPNWEMNNCESSCGLGIKGGGGPLRPAHPPFVSYRVKCHTVTPTSTIPTSITGQRQPPLQASPAGIFKNKTRHSSLRRRKMQSLLNTLKS